MNIKQKKDNLERYSRYLLLFFAISALEGLFTLNQLLILQPSEETNSIIFGLSLRRLLIISFFSLIFIIFTILFIYGILRKNWLTNASKIIHQFCTKHELFSSSLIILLPLFLLFSIVLLAFSNTNLFPRFEIYAYIFVLIKPFLIWIMLFTFHGTIIFLIIEWIPKDRRGVVNSYTNWRSVVLLGVSILIQLFLWRNYLNDPYSFIANKAINNKILLVLFIALVLGITNLPKGKSFSKKEEDKIKKLSLQNTRTIKQKRDGIQSFLYVSTTILFLVITIASSISSIPSQLQDSSFKNDIAGPLFSYGFDQLKYSSIEFVLIFLLLIIIFLYLSPKMPNRIRDLWQRLNSIISDNNLVVLAVSLLSGILFFFFSSNYSNNDLRYFREYYPEFMLSSKPFIMFDEMWESFLHFRFYSLTNTLFNWNVDLSMQIFACLCGIFSIFLIFQIGKVINPSHPLLPSIILTTGGYMQIFFGDMEQYPLVTIFVLLFILTSLRFIQQKISLVIPSIIYVLAITSHFASIYLFPALIFLYVIEMNKKDYFSIAQSIMASLSLMSLSLIYLINQGVTLQRLTETSWGLGRGGSILDNFVSSFDFTYFAGQINLLFLIFPLIWTLPYLLIFNILPGLFRKRLDLIFLFLASFSGIVFFFIWKTGIGLYNDWNLFSVIILPACILVASGLSNLNNFRYKWESMVVSIAWSYLLTYAWIINNHFIAP